jgi:8-oxo-dGTP pyrophosphatase MutT (NUDIX family)
MDSCVVRAVGVWFYCVRTRGYLYLLRNDSKYSDTWGLAGGKVDTGESVAEGLNREIQEELGGKILSPKFIPVEKFTSTNEQFVYHTFFVAIDDEFVPELNDEHLGYAWLPLTAAPRPLHPGVSRTLNSQDIVKKIQTAESTYKT